MTFLTTVPVFWVTKKMNDDLGFFSRFAFASFFALRSAAAEESCEMRE